MNEDVEEQVEEKSEEAPEEIVEKPEGKSKEPEKEVVEEPHWRDFVGDDFKKDAERFDEVDAIFQSLRDMRKMVSDRIKIPGEEADEKELAKYRKAIGVPEEAESYTLELPEGMELSEADEAFIETLKPLAFENNVPQTAFEGFALKFKELESQLLSEQVAELEKQRDETLGQLQKDWGRDFEANVNIANRAIKSFAGEDFLEFANTAKVETGEVLANHPHMVKLFAKLGRQMSEDGIIAPVDADTAKDLQTKIQEKTTEMHAAHQKGDRREAQRLDQERNALVEQLEVSQPVVGSQNRAV